jgi:hypothetical protein
MTIHLPERPQKDSFQPQEENNRVTDMQQIVKSLEDLEPFLRKKGFTIEISTENINTKPSCKSSVLQIMVKDDKNKDSQSPFFMRNPTFRLEVDEEGKKFGVSAKPYYGIGSVPVQYISNYFDLSSGEKLESVKKLVEDFLGTTIRNSVPA